LCLNVSIFVLCLQVAIKFCHKCLGQISYDVKSQQSESNSQKICHFSSLIKHLASAGIAEASLTTQSKVPEQATSCNTTPKNTQCSLVAKKTNLTQDVKVLSLPKFLPQLGSKRIQITVVRNKAPTKSRFMKIQPKKPFYAAANINPASFSIRPAVPCALQPPKTVQLGNGLKRVSILNPSTPEVLAPSPVLNAPKSSPLKLAPVNQAKLAKLRILKLVNSSQKGSCGLAARIPAQASSVSITNNAIVSKKTPIQMIPVKPLTSVCPNSIVSKGKVLGVFPRINNVNKQALQFISPSTLPNNALIKRLTEDKSAPSPLETSKQSQSTKRRAGSSSKARKKLKKEEPIPKSNTNTPEKNTTQNPSATTPQDGKKTTPKRSLKQKPSRSPSCSKMQIRLKAANKKKAVEKKADAVPMKTIISNYLSKKANEKGTTTFNTANNSARQRRSKHR